MPQPSTSGNGSIKTGDEQGLTDCGRRQQASDRIESKCRNTKINFALSRLDDENVKLYSECHATPPLLMRLQS